MSVSAAMVMSLRERTGAGMMECKKFLVAANGDIELAIIEMRKAGQAKADKKADRIAAEGVVVVARTKDLRHSVMLEIVKQILRRAMRVLCVLHNLLLKLLCKQK